VAKGLSTTPGGNGRKRAGPGPWAKFQDETRRSAGEGRRSDCLLAGGREFRPVENGAASSSENSLEQERAAGREARPRPNQQT